MIRPVCHPATGRRFDLAAATAGDIEFLRQLREDLPAREHGLTCEAPGGGPVYVYKLDGAYWVRHFKGGAHHGDHRVEPESDAHKRGKEYAHAAVTREGFTAGTEISSNRGTKSDVVAFGSVVAAAEIQASGADGRVIKARDTRARRATAITTPDWKRELTAGISPVWMQIHDGAADWLHRVPSARAAIRYGTWTEMLPRPRSVGAAGIRSIDPEPCRPGSRLDHCPLRPGGFCGAWHPFATATTGLTLDDVFVQVASGLLVPVRYYTGYVYLTDQASADVYAELGGDGTWEPGAALREHRPGPCRWRMHTAEDERERVTREQAERAHAESQRAELERVEREQVLQDRYWNMYRLARLRREERELPQHTRSPGRIVMAARHLPEGDCNCPGCGRKPARLYPCGWRCDEHKPQPARKE